MKFWILSAFVLLAAGCASIPTFQSKDNLVAYQSSQAINLDEDVIYEVQKGMVTWFFGVRKGSYVAKYQDETGYYFEGAGYSACMGTQGKTGGCTSNLVGGIWQSKNKLNDYRMYYIDGSSEKESPNIQGYALTLNKYVIENKSDDFSTKIRSRF
jgi:hypothetical protein